MRKKGSSMKYEVQYHYDDINVSYVVTVIEYVNED